MINLFQGSFADRQADRECMSHWEAGLEDGNAMVSEYGNITLLAYKVFINLIELISK